MRGCIETWHLQSKDGPVTVEALEAVLSRSMVPILRHLEDSPHELVMALLAELGAENFHPRLAASYKPSCREEKALTFLNGEGMRAWSRRRQGRSTSAGGLLSWRGEAAGLSGRESRLPDTLIL